jgi:hypothetical protein
MLRRVASYPKKRFSNALLVPAFSNQLLAEGTTGKGHGAPQKRPTFGTPSEPRTMLYDEDESPLNLFWLLSTDGR